MEAVGPGFALGSALTSNTMDLPIHLFCVLEKSCFRIYVRQGTWCHDETIGLRHTLFVCLFVYFTPTFLLEYPFLYLQHF